MDSASPGGSAPSRRTRSTSSLGRCFRHSIASRSGYRRGMGESDTRRRAKFYRLTRLGRKQLEIELRTGAASRWRLATPWSRRHEGPRIVLAMAAGAGSQYLAQQPTRQRAACRIDSHVNLLTDEKIARGLAPDAARRAALREFGSVDALGVCRRGARPRTRRRIRSHLVCRHPAGARDCGANGAWRTTPRSCAAYCAAELGVRRDRDHHRRRGRRVGDD